MQQEPLDPLCISGNLQQLGKMYLILSYHFSLNGQLPPPVTGVPCSMVLFIIEIHNLDVNCTEGTYLRVNDFSCQACAAGAFSVGGGKKWTDWNYLPAQFSTYCAATNTQKYCRSWRMNGDNADSGNNYNYDNLESNLELRVKVHTHITTIWLTMCSL